MRKLLLVCLAVMLTSSCALVSVNLQPETRPLEEKLLEGEGADKVVLVSIEGIITEEKPRPKPFSLTEPVGMIALLKEQLTKAEKDPAVKALVVKVNSPGGGVTASDIIYHELAAFKNRKEIPVVACLMDVAASGGYYAACAADRIIAHPTTVTGSIGVLAIKVSAAGLLGKIGIENETLATGDKKDMWSPLRPLTVEERAIFREIIDSLDERFLAVVTSTRKPAAAALATFSDGRILEAGEAVRLGLIDRLGYVDDAIEEAKALAGIKEARVVTYARPREWRHNVYSVLGPPREPSLLGFDAGWLSTLGPGVHFLYLWAP
jgi:protease-4